MNVHFGGPTTTLDMYQAASHASTGHDLPMYPLEVLPTDVNIIDDTVEARSFCGNAEGIRK